MQSREYRSDWIQQGWLPTEKKSGGELSRAILLKQKVCCSEAIQLSSQTNVLRLFVVASALPSLWLLSIVGALPNCFS